MNLLLYGVVALGILGMLGGIGYKIRESGYDSCKVDWAAAEVVARKAELAASEKAAVELAAERAKRKIVKQKVTTYVDKLVERPVYRNICLDADGLRCVNASLLGESGAGCKPEGGVPAAKPPA